MPVPRTLFETECRDDTVIVSATGDLTEFAYEALEDQAATVMQLLQDEKCRNVVVDLSRSQYCGSTALGLFLKIWKLTRGNKGHMAFSGLSANEREVFSTMKLDSLWPICQTLNEAVDAVQR